MGMFFNEDRKTYCGTYKGVKVWGYGSMIGHNWYGDYYCTIPRGESKREMKVKESVCKSIEGIKEYIDTHLPELRLPKTLKYDLEGFRGFELTTFPLTIEEKCGKVVGHYTNEKAGYTLHCVWGDTIEDVVEGLSKELKQ